MSIDAELQALAAPLSPDQPCGEDLEDTQLLASFDGFRLFGQTTALPQVDWREVKSHSLEALQKSKDLRLLAHYAAAALRVDGWPGFLGAICVAAGWLKNHWNETWPRITDDAILRKNALNCLADRMAIIDGVRRTPFIVNRQIGAFSLRDVEIAAGQLQPTEADTAPATQDQVTAALTAAALEELQSFDATVTPAIDGLRQMDAAMREQGGSAAAPDFDPLLAALVRIQKLIREQIAVRTASGETAGAEGGAEASGGGGAIAVGNIKSRADAIRVLDAVAAFFRQNEPSSPVPLFVERAKRLVGRDFLEVLQDVAPDGLPAARAAGGVTES